MMSPITSSLIEPYKERRERRAFARKISIEHETVKLRAAYIALGLPVPPALAEKKPDPTIRSERSHAATGGGRGRPPNAARAAAMAAGRRTYMGKPCPSGHSGLRYVKQSCCVECGRLRQEARESTIRPRNRLKPVNHSAQSRAQGPELPRGRVRDARWHSRTPAR